jgi:hypothetical protein
MERHADGIRDVLDSDRTNIVRGLQLAINLQCLRLSASDIEDGQAQKQYQKQHSVIHSELY